MSISCTGRSAVLFGSKWRVNATYFPVCGRAWASEVRRGIGVLVEMPPQGNLGRGEASVIWKRV